MGRRKGQSEPGGLARDRQDSPPSGSLAESLLLSLRAVRVRREGEAPVTRKCAVPHRSDGKRPPFMTELSGRRTGQMAFVLSSRPRTSAWHEHTVCLPEAAEARRGSAPRGRGNVRTSVCERVRRAGVGRREATGPQNHSSAGQGVFCGQVFHFPFLCQDWTLAVMWAQPRWPSTTTEGGRGVWLLNTAGLPQLREGSHVWKSPFLPNTGARREGPRREAPLSQHLIPWGNLTSAKPTRPAPILRCECWVKGDVLQV